MADVNGKGGRGRDYNQSAWSALDHTEAVRAEGRRYRPGRIYNRPDLSERETACQPQRAVQTDAQREGVVVCLDKARPGRIRRGRRVDRRQTELFE